MPATLKQTKARQRNYSLLIVRGAISQLEQMILNLGDAGYSARELRALAGEVAAALVWLNHVTFELDKLYVRKEAKKGKGKVTR